MLPLVIAGVTLFIVLSRDKAEGAVIYEPPLAPGVDPFTSPIDVPAAGVGAIIPTPTPSPSGTATATPPAVPRGNFGGTGFTTVCDRELLIRQLQARPSALAAWAGVHGLVPEAVASYIRSLRPASLTEDTRVTNHRLSNGKAVTFQSIQPAGTAVLLDDAGRIVARCRCGNPLLEPKPVGSGTCSGCPKNYTPPALLPRGKVPSTVVAINPPPVAGASPSPTATPSPPSANLSIGATGTASATFSSQWDASYGIDNDPRTSWFSKGPEPANNNTSTYTVALKAASTLTHIEFVDNSQNTQDPSVRSGFGFRSWKIELLGAHGNVIATLGPASDPLRSQTLRFAPVTGVTRVRFIGSQHEDPTCGGFGALWVYGYAA